MLLATSIINISDSSIKKNKFRLFSIKLSIETFRSEKRGWDKSPSLSIIFGLSSKTQWLSGLYYADFISFYSPTQLCGGGTTKSNSNELPISVPLSFSFILKPIRHSPRFHHCSDGKGASSLQPSGSSFLPL